MSPSPSGLVDERANDTRTACSSSLRSLQALAARDDPAASAQTSPRLRLSSGGRPLASFRAEGPPAAIVFLGEVYRRGSDWKFRALGQEFRAVQDLASFLGLDEETVRQAVRAVPMASKAPVDATEAPRVSLSRPTKASASPPPVMVQSVPEAPPSQSGGPTRPAIVDKARAFAMRGWDLTPAGIVAGVGRIGEAVIERELLDLRTGVGGRAWPGFFTHDPSTGTALATIPIAPCSGQMLANGSGLLEVEGGERLDAAGHRDVEDVPMGARLFANGGDPARLIAIDPSEGRCWWRAPLSRRWVALGRLPSAGPTRIDSLGAAGTSAGVFYAASGTLAHVLHGQSPSIRLIDLEGDHVAPPFALGSVIAVPVDAVGRLCVASMQPDGTLGTIAVRDAPPMVEQLGRPFGEPGAGRCYWLGRRGFLTLDDVGGRAVARWNVWPPETEGLPFLPPYQARNGRLWAFALRISGGGRSREGAVACSLGPEGVREVRDLPGPFLSVGQAVFRGRERFRDPWSSAEEEISLGLDYPGRWLLPLVRIGGRQTLVGLVEEPPGASTVRDFVFREGTRRAHGVALAVHTDNGALELLRQSFEIGSTDDLDVFRDGDRICVNHAESDTCASWPLV